MTKKYDFTNPSYYDGESQTGLVKGSSCTDALHGKRLIYIILAVVVLLALALGLALGLGLKTHASSTPGGNSQASTQNETKTSPPTPTSISTSTEHPTSPHPTSTQPSSTKPTSPRPSLPPGGWMSIPCSPLPTSPTCPWSADERPMILMSLDGFRADYLTRGLTPAIDKLRDCGVHSPYMRSVYPTITFPNHYTIVTGLYPESHGIVDNSMYDENVDAVFTIGGSVKSDSRWWGGEPIWITAKKAGKKTASYFWVGSEFNVSGHRPDYFEVYNGSVPYHSRVDKVMEWLGMDPQQRPQFITIYFDEPDHAGHGYGPNSTEVNDQLARVDRVVHYLMDSLYRESLHHCVDLVIVADHGMEDTSCQKSVLLDCFTDMDRLLAFDGPMVRIDSRFAPGSDFYHVNKNTPPLPVQPVASDLDCVSPHFKVFTRDTMPRRFHYLNNRRIGNLIVDMEEGWTAFGQKMRNCLKGNHGWDNLEKHMHALFLAFGPSFKQNVTVDPFENIELYGMMCDVLGLQPAPNNGTRGSLYHLLTSPPPVPTTPTPNPPPTCLSNSSSAPWLQNNLCGCQSTQKLTQSLVDNSDDVFPWGKLTMTSGNDVCILHQQNATTYFSKALRMPSLVAARISSAQYTIQEPDCIVMDRRLPDDVTDAYHDFLQPRQAIVPAALLPGLTFVGNCGNTSLSSAMVPMYQSFRDGVWRSLMETVRTLVQQYGDMQVQAGPVFDQNYDGLSDSNHTKYVDDAGRIPLPTHFFLTLTRCASGAAPCADLLLQSFVLPHVPKVPNCLGLDAYLEDNVARLRDVELLTGVRMLTSLEPTLAARHRTFLPTQLWQPTPSPGVFTRDSGAGPLMKKSWVDMDCETVNNKLCYSDYRPLLLVSLDGFRADYLLRNATPVIAKLIQRGVHAPYMRSVYPTKTFPNHYTIVTGLYPESHGIVDNSMYDPTLQSRFGISRPEAKDIRWWGGEPIWLTAKRQGKKAASYFWVGSDVPGLEAEIYRNYSDAVTFTQRVDEVLGWLDNERPEFITLYFNEPDHTGHSTGTQSAQIPNMLAEVDGVLGKLMDGLVERNMHSCVNIIVVADHGMTDLSCNRMVSLVDHISRNEQSKLYIYDGPFGRISSKYRQSGSNIVSTGSDSLKDWEILDRLECASPHLRVYEKSALPRRHHYAFNRRIDNIVLDVDDEWLVDNTVRGGMLWGDHGYDNIFASMHALFLAYGPAFKSGFTIDGFENIELYNLMTGLLGIDPAPNNGTQGTLDHILASPPKRGNDSALPDVPRCTAGAVTDFQGTSCQCAQAGLTSSPNQAVQVAMVQGGNETCVLDFNGRKTGYSSSHHSPLWSSVTLTPSQAARAKATPVASEMPCVMEDSRQLSADRLYFRHFTDTVKGLDVGKLVEGNWTDCSAISSAEAVPMYKVFREGIWKFLWEVVVDYADRLGPVSVTAGPVVDYDLDGLADSHFPSAGLVRNTSTPLPTHFFLVVARCGDRSQSLPCPGTLQLLSFLLPHREGLDNCLAPRDYLRENVARVRDVELITGLTFFPDLDPATSARLRTFLPVELWPSSVLAPKAVRWIDQQCPVPAADQCKSSYRPVLLVSLDGFKAEYLARNLTPTLQRLADCGVHAPYMRSVYPTKTFPNHYSIVTGLYPESHGIIDNNMFDIDLNVRFSLSSAAKLDPRFWGGEPIWLTAMKQNHSAATYFWPGSDVAIQGVYPDRWREYSDGVPFEQRVDTVLGWLTLPERERPSFLTLYFHEPDLAGHIHGPDAAEVNDVLKSVDAVLGRLMEGLYQRDLHNCVNLIVVADHGMTAKPCQDVISLNTTWSSSTFGKMYVYEGVHPRISNKYGYNTIFNRPQLSLEGIMQDLQCFNENMEAYLKGDLPKRHHYSNNDRIDDVVIKMKDHYSLVRYSTTSCGGGDHGYDNIYSSMHALFLAHGPAFKQNLQVEPFENIELYNMMADILGVNPAPNNGTRGSLDFMLTTPPTRHTLSFNQSALCETGMPTPSSNRTTCNCTVQASTSMAMADVPAVVVSAASCRLQDGDVQTEYSRLLHMPLFVSSTIGNGSKSLTTSGLQCIAEDWRVGSAELSLLQAFSNQSADIVASPLLPGLSCNTGSLSSQTVPMYEGFRRGVWEPVLSIITNYTRVFGQLAITAGPVFDYVQDGLWEGRTNATRYVDSGQTVPLPTHFFLTVSKCAQSGQRPPCNHSLDILSFILPHKPNATQCRWQTVDGFLQENVARLRDVELLTGLQFFPALPLVQAARLRTFLPTSLWLSSPSVPTTPTPTTTPAPTVKPGSWMQQPCFNQTVQQQCPSNYRPVLLVSLDGFKAEYLARNLTPTLQRLADCGVHAPYMRSVYPTKTFPNHYSIVTGLYPESHGVVDNSMYDSTIGTVFSMSASNASDPRWWGGEPVWVTAELQGKKSATYFWPGSEVVIKGRRPTYSLRYSDSTPFSERVDQVLEWLSLPNNTRPEMLTLYFNEPDHTAHEEGPSSPQVNAQLQAVDKELGRLMEGLYQRNLHQCVNLIVVADHGFNNISCDRVLELSELLTGEELNNAYVYQGPFGRIALDYAYRDSTHVRQPSPPLPLETLKRKLNCQAPGLSLYTPATMPVRHHYSHNPRIDSVILDMEPGWTLSRTKSVSYCSGGSHGWDNAYKSMTALFLAYGPSFKSQLKVEPFENIELYNLMCELLNLTAAPNNGTEGSLRHFLRQSRPLPTSATAQSQYITPSGGMNVSNFLSVSRQCQCDLNDTQLLQRHTAATQTGARQHTLRGLPVLNGPWSGSVSLVSVPSHTTAFSSLLQQPLWIAAFLNASQVTPNQLDEVSTRCTVPHPVLPIPASSHCGSSFTQGPIWDSALFTWGDEVAFESETIPMYEGFKRGIWRDLMDVLGNWTQSYGQLHVLAAPAFDHDMDSLPDPQASLTKHLHNSRPVPSHVVVVVSRCNNRSQDLSICTDLLTSALILPHLQQYSDFYCQGSLSYLIDNEARVRDAELLTGMTFFHDLDPEKSVKLRTYLPHGLWGLRPSTT